MVEALSTETLQKFAGGEAEIQNENENYLFRGEIASIAIENNELQIKFAWFAKNRGGAPPQLSEDWDIDPELDYGASLEIYYPSDIGDGRISFSSWIVGETIVLFPIDGSKMNPERIHGLPDEIKAKQAEKFRSYNESR